MRTVLSVQPVEVALIVMTDGRRDCIAEAIPSLEANLVGPITTRLIHDDSGDVDYWFWLRERFPAYHVFGPQTRTGFGGAYRHAWQWLALQPEPWVFSTEDDFTFNRPVDLIGMATAMWCNPHLVQMALRRQPWNDEERAAGGLVEQHPDDYAQVAHVGASTGNYAQGIDAWLEHRRFFTTNPSLYRRSLCARGWPNVEHSEGVFTHQLLEDPDVRFGYWGARDSGEAVTHIGRERVGTGY